MAVIETWLKQDLQELVQVKCLTGNLFSLDNGGNLIGVEVTNGGEPATLAGTVTANAILADGSTVAITGGNLSGNKVSVVLPEACYAVLGNITIAIKLTYNTTVTTLGCVIGVVYRSSTDTPVDPGTIIPSIQDLITQIQTAVGSIPADYSALWTTLAPAYTQKPYVIGEYCTNGGVMYRCRKEITQGKEFASSDWEAANIGNDLRDMIRIKRAVNDCGVPEVVPDDWENGYISDSTGLPTTSGATIRTKYYYPISTSGTFEFTGVATSDRIYFGYYYDKNLNFLQRAYTSIPGNAYFVRFTYGFTSASGMNIATYGFDNAVADWGIKYKSPVRTDAESMTGLTPIEMKWGYYINIGTNETIDITAEPSVSTSGYGYAIVDAVEGDVFTVNSKGGSGARGFAFIDSEGNVLAKSGSSAEVTGYRLVAPKNSAKLIINAHQSDKNSYIGYTVSKDVERTYMVIYNERNIRRKFSISETPTFTIVQGSLNTSNGADYSSSASTYSKRIKSQEFIKNQKDATLHLISPMGYWFYIYMYNSNSSDGFIGMYTWNNSMYLAGEYDIIIDCAYVRFAISKIDGGETFSPEEFPAEDFTFEFVKPVDAAFASAETDLMMDTNGYVDYGYINPYHQDADPNGTSIFARMGVDVCGPVVTLNKTVINESSILRIRISGNGRDVGYATTTNGVKAFAATVSLIPGHRYVGTLKLLSGTSLYNADSTTNQAPPLCFYKSGESNIAGTGERSNNGAVYKRTFTAEDVLYCMAIQIENGHYLMTDAKCLITLQDLDADIPAANVPESLIADKDEPTATANHSAGDVFICQNQLLRATDAIATGESIVIGTSGNAESITLADYIKEIVTSLTGVSTDVTALKAKGTDPDMALTVKTYTQNLTVYQYSSRYVTINNGVINFRATNVSTSQRSIFVTGSRGTGSSNLANTVPPVGALEPISKLEGANALRVRYEQISETTPTVYLALYYCTLNDSTVTVVGYEGSYRGLPYGKNHLIPLTIPETATHYAISVYESTAVNGEVNIYPMFTVIPTT